MSTGRTAPSADIFVLVNVRSGRALYAYASLAEAEQHLAAEFSVGRVVVERR